MEGGGMEPKDVLSLGRGLRAPWKLAGQRLDIEKRPNELHLEVVADRGALFPCPDCKRACKAHDFESFTWRHLNFFQHHCLITARVPRVDCPDHGVKRVTVPWARPGSRFTLLFEQAALILAREMPVAAAARFMGITDKRLWRILQHYVARAVGALDLGSVLTNENADVQSGINIVLRALESPIRQIAENSGVEGSIVVSNVMGNKSQTF